MFAVTITLGTRVLTPEDGPTLVDQDVFVAELDPAGEVTWATRAGGKGADWASSLARDRAGNLYVAGSFEQTGDFGGAPLTSRGESDLFIWKIGATPD
jgi:hypothetical protein